MTIQEDRRRPTPRDVPARPAKLSEEEQWLPVVGWEHGYEVSSHGRVRSIPRYTKRGLRLAWNPGRVLKQNHDDAGYARVGLSSPDSVKTTMRVHVLVATAFLPRPESAECVRHDDGDCTNNRVENLLWGTHEENNLDSVRHGTSRQWTSTGLCARGHRLEGPNLGKQSRSKGKRCSACRRAYCRAWRVPDQAIDVDALADEIYEHLMKGFVS